LQINQDFAAALITKSLAYLALKQNEAAAASLEKFLALRPDDLDADVWREQLDTLRARIAKSAESTGTLAVSQPAEDLPLAGKEVTTKVRILSKPEPTYTKAARMAGVTGTVVIRCVFGSDGQVKNLVVTQALGYGLTSRAAQAARKIRFVPATKEGRQVSMFMQLEYNFNLY
jgi:TonB family protein